MNKEQYLAFHKACCEKMVQITAAKNADYTGSDPSPFANFNRVSLLGICTTEQGFLVRLSDKLSRIISFMQKGELLVKDESVEDTILDACNYLILLAGYLQEKRESSFNPEDIWPTDFATPAKVLDEYGINIPSK